MPPPQRVALETTLLVHGVPRGEGLPLAHRLADAVRSGGKTHKGAGAEPAIVGVVGGAPVVGMSDAQLASLLDQHERHEAGEAETGVPKVNAANLGLVMHRKQSGATTVSATVELAARAGVCLFATGGLGGVHKGLFDDRGKGEGGFDISADLFAVAKWPVAVMCSGVKSLLDVEATRELLETLGVPVVGYRCDRFPAFYLRESPNGGGSVDERFDDAADLAAFLRHELARRGGSGGGVVVCNPVPEKHEIDAHQWAAWLRQAEESAEKAGVTGRDVTPHVLAALHLVSHGATLRTNLALAEANAKLAGEIARHW